MNNEENFVVDMDKANRRFVADIHRLKSIRNLKSVPQRKLEDVLFLLAAYHVMNHNTRFVFDKDCATLLSGVMPKEPNSGFYMTNESFGTLAFFLKDKKFYKHVEL